MNDLGNKMAKGAAWMVGFKIAERGIGLISTVILARLLVPADFGLVAMAMAIIAVLELLSAFSFDVSLIQNQQTERRHYDTAWTFNVILAGAGALVLILLASPAARFYTEDRLEPVMYVLALGMLVHGFENIGTVAFRKELQFNKEFKFLIAKKLVAFCVTLVLAFTLKNYWALVGGMLCSKFAGVALSYAIQPYKPRFSLKAAPELFHFSKWLLINNMVLFLYHRSSDFIIGRLSGTHALGIFTIAREISCLPTTELVAPINRAVFPGYAKMAADRRVLQKGFLDVISIIALIGVPTGAGIGICAGPLVRVFLGERWLDAVPLIQVLAAYGVVTALQTNMGSILLALGRPRVLTILAGVHVLTLVPALLWLTSEKGVIGAAWASLGTALFLAPLNYFLVLKLLGMGPMPWLERIWRPVLATVIMIGAVSAASLYLNGLTDIVQLATAVITGAVTYCTVIFSLWSLLSRPSGAERLIWDKLTLKMSTKMTS
jgi:lipopolysaccharide exporter